MKTTTLIFILALALGYTFLAQPTTATATPYALEWTEQLGTSGDDYSLGVSADGLGNVYISGYTEGDLGGTSAGNSDAFIAKYSVVPEPTTCTLALAALCLVVSRRKLRQSPGVG